MLVTCGLEYIKNEMQLFVKNTLMILTHAFWQPIGIPRKIRDLFAGEVVDFGGVHG